MLKKNNLGTIHIIANAALGPYMSGGDKIFIELARKWAEIDLKIVIYVWEEGFEMCMRNNLSHANIEYVLWNTHRFKNFGFMVNYLARVFKGISYSFRIKKRDATNEVIYSASDFWPDSIPAYFLKKKLLKSKWVAGFYLFAPNPIRGFSNSYKRFFALPRLKDIMYYFHQRPIYRIIKKNADLIFVTGEEDQKKIINDGVNAAKVVVMYGGVDFKTAKNYLRNKKNIQKKIYNACFIGRFHPQKGILELIQIWSLVVKKIPDAMLAIIGADSEDYKKKVIEKINKLEISKNINLLGYLDGWDKYDIFLKSKIILHPAIYDSGGMAACEGMAWGLPAIGFDLESLKTYYSQGMLKASVGNFEDFAKKIIKLSEDTVLYLKVRQEAISLASEWDWSKRAKLVIAKLNNLI